MTLPDPELQPEFYADVPLKRVGAWAIDLVVTLAITLVGLVMTLFVSIFSCLSCSQQHPSRIEPSCWRAMARPWG